MEALASFDEFIPDLVITDLTMPVMSGTDLVQAMQARPRLAHIPIVLMTGGNSTRVPAGYPLLHKPFPLQELIATVRGLLP